MYQKLFGSWAPPGPDEHSSKSYSWMGPWEGEGEGRKEGVDEVGRWKGWEGRREMEGRGSFAPQ